MRPSPAQPGLASTCPDLPLPLWEHSARFFAIFLWLRHPMVSYFLDLPVYSSHDNSIIVRHEQEDWRNSLIHIDMSKKKSPWEDSCFKMQLLSISYPLGWQLVKTNKQTESNKCWQGCRESSTFVNFWWGCKVVWSLWKTVWQFLKQIKMEWPYNVVILLLGMYPKDWKQAHKEVFVHLRLWQCYSP